MALGELRLALALNDHHAVVKIGQRLLDWEGLLPVVREMVEPIVIKSRVAQASAYGR